jgi:hypothetical protein
MLLESSNGLLDGISVYVRIGLDKHFGLRCVHALDGVDRRHATQLRERLVDQKKAPRISVGGLPCLASTR